MLWHGPRVLPDLLREQVDGGLELRIRALEGGVRQIVNHLVRIDAMSFDQPDSLRSIYADLRR